MKASPILLALTAAAAVTGCQTKAPTRDLEVQLTSASPVTFSGTITVDGKDQAVSGSTPTTLNLHGQTVRVDVRQGTEPGTLTIEVRSPELPARLTMVTASTGPQTAATGSATFP